jgi:pseudouridine synthase
MAMSRICKFLSLCGVSSRRGGEALIKEGRVAVNGNTVEELGTVIDVDKDEVKVDGTTVKPVSDKRTMTTLHDPFRRRTVAHLIKNVKERVYPVGRLDYDTEGVLTLTNDGELAFRLAHPRYKVKKVYEAVVKGEFTKEDISAIAAGIKLEDGAIGRAEVSILSFVRQATRIRLTLTEGRKREVKQLCKAVRHPVKSLKRVEFAGINARGLAPGSWRMLTDNEVQDLKTLVGL